jgi:alpha-methylacyl-CoA racemase
MTELRRSGPLSGVRIMEFSGLGPAPHAAMLLSDMGAEVLHVERPGGNAWPNVVVGRGRFGIEVDIRSEEGRERILDAVGHVDVLIEGYRPGVMERLGLGPDILLQRHPSLIYARMTGWGQTGPKAHTAGHDINYIALTGILAGMTDSQGMPKPPLNLIGDFGGGSLYLVMGILAALYEREHSGLGQVIDAAMVDGAASLMASFCGSIAVGDLSLEPEKSLLGGAAPFYRCYQCSDGEFISVGAIEPQFYDLLLKKIGAPVSLIEDQHDWENWASRTVTLAEIFRQKTREEWCAILENTDACFAPVLSLDEAPQHRHMQARGSYVDIEGTIHPAPAPRFSRTPSDIGEGGEGKDLIERWKASCSD